MMETLLYQLIVLFLGIIVGLLTWLGNRLFTKMDVLIDELHDHSINWTERHHRHETRIKVLEVNKD